MDGPEVLTPICESWKKIQKLRTELASILGKKSIENSKNRVLGTEPASFLEKNPEFFHEYSIMIFKKLIFLGTEPASFLEKKSMSFKIIVTLSNPN